MRLLPTLKTASKPTPLFGRLQLAAFSLQALRAFERVETQLLAGASSSQSPSSAGRRCERAVASPLCIGQRLRFVAAVLSPLASSPSSSSDSFSSSGFGSVSAVSQQSAADATSCASEASATLAAPLPPLPMAPLPPISLFDRHAKNILLLREAASQGFGFSIAEAANGAIVVAAVKGGGMAAANGERDVASRPQKPQILGVCAGDLVLQVCAERSRSRRFSSPDCR